MTKTPCPLCGVELDLPTAPEPPTETLARLQEHFSSDCKATERVFAVADVPEEDTRNRAHDPRH